MKKYRLYYGLRFYDQNSEIIFDAEWDTDHGTWTSLEDGEIFPNETIIGLKCDSESHPNYLIHLGFILGIKDKTELSRELRIGNI